MKRSVALIFLLHFAAIIFAQNVGIGTSTPTTARLVISGSSGEEGLDLSSTDQYANLRVLRNSLNGSDKDMYIGFLSGAISSLHLFSNNSESMTIKAGKVGIGITTPAFPLNFASTTGDKISLYGNVNGDSHYGFGIQAGLLQIHSNLAVDDIAFGYGSSNNFTERMRVKGNGNVGIGTPAPAAKLHITGDQYLDGALRIRNASTTSNYGLIQHTGVGGNLHIDTYGTGSIFLNWFSGGGIIIGNGAAGFVAAFTNAGNLGIGNNTPDTKLVINGSSRLGEESPKIKMKLITGTTGSSQDFGNVNTTVYANTGVPSGNILSVSVLVYSSYVDFVVPPKFTQAGLEYNYGLVGGTTIKIENANLNSAYILSRPFTALVVYQE
jgi:hypothetical protein